MTGSIQANDPKVIVALDYDNQMAADQFVEQIKPELCKLKVGKELFTATGPAFVDGLVKQGFDVFLDLKFHDIPNTVAKAVAVAADMGVWLTDVHASGGRKMMEAAKQQLLQNNSDMLLIAVTVLTSMDAEDLQEIGVNQLPNQQVGLLAQLAKDSGMHGVVCSAMETSQLRQQCGDDFTLVTPGIRPDSETSSDDQKRIVTPAQAIQNGSSYLVIGRPITQAQDPLAALLAINSQIS